MAMTYTAPFAQTPKTGFAICTSASSSLTTTTPTETVKIVTAGANGAILTALSAMPRATVAASCLLVWVSKDAGTTKYLIDSALMAAHTVASNTAIPATTFSTYSEDNPFRLQAADEIYVGSAVALAGGIVFEAEYTDF